MIPVKFQLEPEDFHEKVRMKGRAFLQNSTPPINFQNHEQWTLAIPDMMRLYNENCAYSGLRLWAKSQEATVDHFLPKAKNPGLAYEWSNFRLCNRRINGWKGEKNVVDPFEIQSDWFYLDFDSLKVKVQDHIESNLKIELEKSIAILRLNDRSFVEYRSSWYMRYLDASATLELLQKDACFVAYELERQKILLHNPLKSSVSTQVVSIAHQNE